MSCLIVGEKTMQDAVSACWMKSGCPHDYPILWDNFYRLNFKAWETRYPKKINLFLEDIRKMHPVTYGVTPVTVWQSLKSVNCLIYNCHEGDVPKDPWFQYLLNAKADCLRECLAEVPE